MKKSCQDLEKNLGKIFSRSCKNLARNQAIQDFRMDLEQESCKIRKILASSKSWHGFKILQDIFDRAESKFLGMSPQFVPHPFAMAIELAVLILFSN